MLYGRDADVLDWWDVFAAPLPSSIPDRLRALLPVGEGELSDARRGSAITHRYLARVLAKVVDDDGEWRVLHLPPHQWAVVRNLEVIVMVDESTGEGYTARRWRGRLPEV